MYCEDCLWQHYTITPMVRNLKFHRKIAELYKNIMRNEEKWKCPKCLDCCKCEACESDNYAEDMIPETIRENRAGQVPLHLTSGCKGAISDE